MYRKRAALLTINCSLASFFTKVRTPRNSLASLKRNLGTAAERSFYQNPSSGSNEDNIAEYQQNPSGSQTHFDLHHKSYNGYSQDSRFIGNTEQNPDGFYRGNPRIDIQHNPVGQNVNFLGGYGTESYKSEFQGNPIGQNGSNFQNTMGQNGNFNGNYGGYSEKLGKNSSGYNNTENWGQFQQSGSDHYSGNNGVPQQKSSNYFRENTITNQQKPENYFSGNTRSTQHYPSNYSGSKNSMNSQSPGHYYPESNTINQSGTSAHYASTGGMHQQRTSGYIGDSVGTPNSYVEYNQYPSGGYNANAGNYQNNSNVSESGMIVSQASNNLKDDGSVEAADSGQNSGTVEELDGFCKEGKLTEVVKLLGLLESQHIQVGLPRYFMLMKACGEAKALQEAKYVHEHLMRSVCIPEVSTYNQILDMYGKCGSMDEAFAVFDKMPQRNLTSWDTMITWLAENGHAEEAIELFTQFKEVGLKPDGKMFIGVFSVCSVLGDVIEGMLHFESMSKDYGIVPSMEHYVSVVDMLGSAGYLDEALEFIEKMPLEPSIDVWETLMNLSRVYGNVELGDRCAELVELMDPSRLNEQSKVGLIPVKASDLAKEKEKKKQASENLLAVRSRIHEYRAGDKSHPEADKIYAQLRGMKEQMKEAGYVPETRFVLHDIEQEGKEEALLAHSERLAVAFGLMSSPVRSPMRIIKNLRVCGDCHSALKIISKLVGRELIIRDAKRFHHFKDGLCSCRDYW